MQAIDVVCRMNRFKKSSVFFFVFSARRFGMNGAFHCYVGGRWRRNKKQQLIITHAACKRLPDCLK